LFINFYQGESNKRHWRDRFTLSWSWHVYFRFYFLMFGSSNLRSKCVEIFRSWRIYNTHTQIHTHTSAYTQIHTHTHTHTYTHKHEQTHAQAHTHKHLHTRNEISQLTMTIVFRKEGAGVGVRRGAGGVFKKNLTPKTFCQIRMNECLWIEDMLLDKFVFVDVSFPRYFFLLLLHKLNQHNLKDCRNNLVLLWNLSYLYGLFLSSVNINISWRGHTFKNKY